MPSEGKRPSFLASEKLLRDLDDFQAQHKCRNRSEAMRILIEKGLEAFRPEAGAPFLSAEALTLAAEYDAMDLYAQKLLRVMACMERERMRDQERPTPALAARKYPNGPIAAKDAQLFLVDEAEESGIDF